MEEKNRHPERTELLRAAAGEPSPSLEQHLRECPVCRELVELLRQFPVAGLDSLEEPSELSRERHVAIGRAALSDRARPTVTGLTRFDSWSGLSAVALRDAGVGLERRLELEAGPIRLELLAQRTERTWEFVARVFRDSRVTAGFVLQVGRKRLIAETDGFYYWTAARPPAKLALTAPDVTVRFPEISWRKSTTP
ncbi:hypothetical protein GF420_05815 [candidate division GN15 bacterium]|nr:hypothetical protein [candidate division GN15 bacterium]